MKVISKPAFSINRAESPSKQHGMVRSPGLAKISRKRDAEVDFITRIFFEDVFSGFASELLIGTRRNSLDPEKDFGNHPCEKLATVVRVATRTNSCVIR